MSKHPWMLLYVDDFRTDTLGLTVDEIGVYFIMILLAWRRGDGSVPGDMNELKRMLKQCIADFHGHTFNRIVPKILESYFQFRDGEWYQKRVVFELEKAAKISEKQSQTAGKRWANHKQNMRKQSLAMNSFNGLANATALPLQLHSQKERKNPPKEDSLSAERKKVVGKNGPRVKLAYPINSTEDEF